MSSDHFANAIDWINRSTDEEEADAGRSWHGSAS